MGELWIPVTVRYYANLSLETKKKWFAYIVMQKVDDDLVFLVAMNLFKTDKPTSRQLKASKRWIAVRMDRAVNALFNILRSHPIFKVYKFNLYSEHDFNKVRVELDDPKYPITWLLEVDLKGNIHQILVRYNHRVKCGDSTAVFQVLAEIWFPEIESSYTQRAMYSILSRYLSD